MKLKVIKNMKECKNCNVNIHTSGSICPLCNNKINTNIDNSIFPKIVPKYKKYNLLQKIIMLLASCGIIFSALINFFINNTLSWALFVILGIFTFLITFTNGIKKKNNFHNLLITENLMFILLSFLWDFYTGFYKWSLIFVLPFLCTLYSITFLIIRIFTNKANKDYIIYTYLNCLIGLLPLYSIITKISKILWPSYISICFSIFTILFLVIFNKNTLEEEIEKRLHI